METQLIFIRLFRFSLSSYVTEFLLNEQLLSQQIPLAFVSLGSAVVETYVISSRASSNQLQYMYDNRLSVTPVAIVDILNGLQTMVRHFSARNHIVQN